VEAVHAEATAASDSSSFVSMRIVASSSKNLISICRSAAIFLSKETRRRAVMHKPDSWTGHPDQTNKNE
jgi:hypothetical protein